MSAVLLDTALFDSALFASALFDTALFDTAIFDTALFDTALSHATLLDAYIVSSTSSLSGVFEWHVVPLTPDSLLGCWLDLSETPDLVACSDSSASAVT